MNKIEKLVVGCLLAGLFIFSGNKAYANPIAVSPVEILFFPVLLIAIVIIIVVLIIRRIIKVKRNKDK